MQLIKLAKAAVLTVLIFILGATPVWSQTNKNSFKETPVLYSQRQSDHDLAEIYFNRGVTRYLQEEWMLALGDFNAAIAFDPNYAEAYLYSGKVSIKQEKLDTAVNEFREAIEINPNYAEAYYNRGTAYIHLQKLDLAVADFTKAIEIDTNYDEAYTQLTVCYILKGNFKKAKESFLHRV